MGWGYIDKCERDSPAAIWLGVEPCETEEEGKARAAELERADPTHQYHASPFLPLPLYVTFKAPRIKGKRK